MVQEFVTLGVVLVVVAVIILVLRRASAKSQQENKGVQERLRDLGVDAGTPVVKERVRRRDRPRPAAHRTKA
ncbi:MAG: hypothetical protein KC464_28060, partial [Myxococcales bacterium]|nr:hypothetical protein [Myxococcales bacterium]